MDFSNVLLGSIYLITARHAQGHTLVEPIKNRTWCNKRTILFNVLASTEQVKTAFKALKSYGMSWFSDEALMEATTIQLNSAFTVEWVDPINLPLYVGWPYVTTRLSNLLKNFIKEKENAPA